MLYGMKRTCEVCGAVLGVVLLGNFVVREFTHDHRTHDLRWQVARTERAHDDDEPERRAPDQIRTGTFAFATSTTIIASTVLPGVNIRLEQVPDPPGLPYTYVIMGSRSTST